MSYRPRPRRPMRPKPMREGEEHEVIIQAISQDRGFDKEGAVVCLEN